MESIVSFLSGRRPVLALLAILSVLLFSSCESAFPNDKLDNFWRLDRMDYRDGTPGVDAKGIYFGIARNIIQIENHQRNFDVYGVLTDMGDSIRLDFSESRINGNHNAPFIKENLAYCGLDSIVSVFKVESLNRSEMVLSTGKVRLSFEKW